jgi:sulfur carrier protein ThiS
MKKEFIVQPYANEHACRVNDPKKYERFARKEFEHEGKKYYAIIGFFKDGGSEVQAYRYPKDIWSEAQAREHCKNHEGETFEAARTDIEQIANEFTAEHVEIEGKDYIKLPVVFLKEGILEGSAGALLHKADVFKDYAEKFNKIPITYMHPQLNNEYVSVKDNGTDVLGFLDNVSYNEQKRALQGYAYIDSALLQNKYVHLHDLINKNYNIEVSVGIYSEIENKEGVFNDRKYIGVVQNYEPDHLAILGEFTGACSYKAGCGIRNNQHKADEIYNNKTNKKMVEMDEKKLTLHELLEKLDDKDKKIVTQALSLLENKKKELIDVIVNANPKWEKKELENECVSQLEKIAEAINNVAKKAEVEQIANVSKEKENEQANYVANATSTTVETSILTL